MVCRWGWSEFPFFTFLCRVCILLVFLRSFFVFSFFYFSIFFSSLLYFFLGGGGGEEGALFAFLCFGGFSFFVSREFSVFQAVAVNYPSVFCHAENCKNCKKGILPDPVYINPVRNFPSDAPFSRLRPNDPALG